MGLKQTLSRLFGSRAAKLEIKPGTCVLYKDANDKIRWHIRAANGEIVASGEAHNSSTDALRAVATVEVLISDPRLNILDLSKAQSYEDVDHSGSKVE
jgi:uncharacterized protein YegP (UPF0339 family)